MGTKQHCLNLSSYNYLGFAASDAYCTPRVQATTRELGVSSCSSRTDAGEGGRTQSGIQLTGGAAQNAVSHHLRIRLPTHHAPVMLS